MLLPGILNGDCPYGSLLAHLTLEPMQKTPKPPKIAVFTVFFWSFLGILVAGCGGIQPKKDDSTASPTRAQTQSSSSETSLDPILDTRPPTAPSNLVITLSRTYLSTAGERCVYDLKWDPAHDDQTSSTEITYQILNGKTVVDEILGKTSYRLILNQETQTPLKIHVRAKDQSGNVSPNSPTLTLSVCSKKEDLGTPSKNSSPNRETHSRTEEKTRPAQDARPELKRNLNRSGFASYPSAHYQIKRDVNCHPDWPDELAKIYPCDTLGTFFGSMTFPDDSTGFVLRRWNPENFPIVFHLHPNALRFEKEIYEVIQELNSVGRDLGITPKLRQNACKDDSGPLICLASHPTTSAIEDYSTHTLRLTYTEHPTQTVFDSESNEVKNIEASISGLTTSAFNYNGEILDADIQFNMPIFEKLVEKIIQNYGDQLGEPQEIYRKHIRWHIMHEMLHAFGLEHNEVGEAYHSMMNTPSMISRPEVELSLTYELEREPGLDYDIQVLRYLYVEDSFLTQGELPDFELNRTHRDLILVQRPST